MFFKKSQPTQPTPSVATKTVATQGTTPLVKPQATVSAPQQQTSAQVVRPAQPIQRPITQPQPLQHQTNGNSVNSSAMHVGTQSSVPNSNINSQTATPIQKPVTTQTLLTTTQQTAPTQTMPATQQIPSVNQGTIQTLNTPSASGNTSDTDKYAKPANYKPPVSTEQKPESPKQDAPIMMNTMEPHEEVLPDGKKVFKADSVSDVNFADLWYTPEGIAYIRDKKTKFALIPFETNDLEDFHKILEQGYTGASSYAAKFKGEAYRVERVMTTTGVQYNLRKMPVSTPNLYKLGIPDPITKYMATLAPESGLILFGGPTGMGKTTTASALMKEFLETHGGFLYTIEDPPEMPLDGLYYAKNGSLGLCKQSPVENERWEDGLKSALRSKPRYILVGEIRTPEVASQTLRAATSGHLVLSTIHATSVEDALNSMIKYAMGSGLDQELVCDLLARGILAVVHQKLEGTIKLHPVLHTCFANPNPLAPDQMRNAIREGKISLGTLMEAQATKLFKGMPMFKEM